MDRHEKEIDNRNRKREAIIKILDGENWHEVEILLEQARSHVEFYAKVKLKKSL